MQHSIVAMNAFSHGDYLLLCLFEYWLKYTDSFNSKPVDVKHCHVGSFSLVMLDVFVRFVHLYYEYICLYFRTSSTCSYTCNWSFICEYMVQCTHFNLSYLSLLSCWCFYIGTIFMIIYKYSYELWSSTKGFLRLLQVLQIIFVKGVISNIIIS